MIATASRTRLTAPIRAYANRIVAGLEHYSEHDQDIVVCASCDVPLPLRKADEIHAAQRTLLMLAWDANRENQLGLTRRQHDALMFLNDRIADLRARRTRRKDD